MHFFYRSTKYIFRSHASHAQCCVIYRESGLKKTGWLPKRINKPRNLMWIFKKVSFFFPLYCGENRTRECRESKNKMLANVVPNGDLECVERSNVSHMQKLYKNQCSIRTREDTVVLFLFSFLNGSSTIAPDQDNSIEIGIFVTIYLFSLFCKSWCSVTNGIWTVIKVRQAKKHPTHAYCPINRLESDQNSSSNKLRFNYVICSQKVYLSSSESHELNQKKRREMANPKLIRKVFSYAHTFGSSIVCVCFFLL